MLCWKEYIFCNSKSECILTYQVHRPLHQLPFFLLPMHSIRVHVLGQKQAQYSQGHTKYNEKSLRKKPSFDRQFFKTWAALRNSLLSNRDFPRQKQENSWINSGDWLEVGAWSISTSRQQARSAALNKQICSTEVRNFTLDGILTLAI